MNQRAGLTTKPRGSDSIVWDVWYIDTLHSRMTDQVMSWHMTWLRDLYFHSSRVTVHYERGLLSHMLSEQQLAMDQLAEQQLCQEHRLTLVPSHIGTTSIK